MPKALGAMVKAGKPSRPVNNRQDRSVVRNKENGVTRLIHIRGRKAKLPQFGKALPRNRNCRHAGASFIIAIETIKHELDNLSSDSTLMAAGFCVSGSSAKGGGYLVGFIALVLQGACLWTTTTYSPIIDSRSACSNFSEALVGGFPEERFGSPPFAVVTRRGVAEGVESAVQRPPSKVAIRLSRRFAVVQRMRTLGGYRAWLAFRRPASPPFGDVAPLLSS